MALKRLQHFSRLSNLESTHAEAPEGVAGEGGGLHQVSAPLIIPAEILLLMI